MTMRALVLAAVIVACAPGVAVSQTAHRNSNIGLGNPSGATTSTSNQYNFLMSKPQFALSYHNGNRTPNWVSWHLSAAWLGQATRQDNFRADTDLPSGWYRVGSSSYSGSGFDRGHMCPSADRTGSTADNSATFLMTNMVPQSPNNNQRGWARLEDYCRKLATSGNELYIVSGPSGTGGTGSAGYRTYIDSNRIKVPNRTWKVILILPNGTYDSSRVTTSTRTIAVNMPNDQSVGNDWGIYRTSINNVQNLTGYNFFSYVPSAVRSVINTHVDTGPTS
jgi:endonuclease G